MEILKNWANTLSEQQSTFKQLLVDCTAICNEYDKSKKETFDIGYNVFTLFSDFYYRENFHSDILKSLLDPKEKHYEQTKYLYLFIDLLNKLNANINKFDFEYATVLRESDNIDILITDESSRR